MASFRWQKMEQRRYWDVKLAEIDRDREWVIPSFQKLVARNNVFEGYKAQYGLLRSK
jgi:hypothetical protein